MSEVSVTRDGPVAVVRLERPQARNALSIELREELAGALEELGADPDHRATVLTGAPPAFCAGMDTTQFGGDEAHRRRLLAANDRFVAALLDHPRSLLAAVNGPALGGGFVLALLCDLRIASPSAEFGFPELHRGIPPSLGAARLALPEALARDLALTGRRLPAMEALVASVVSAVAEDPVAVAVARAHEIAAAPARGVDTVVGWLRGPAVSPREQLERERELLRNALSV